MGNLTRPLQAEIVAERRQSERKQLRLATSVGSSADANRALIHDLSGSGLRLETDAELSVGDIIQVGLPLIGPVDAKVIWRELSFLGCDFVEPISQAAVNAALLKSSKDLGEVADNADVDEVPIGVRPTLDMITEWKIEFDREKGAKGHRVVGFRQTTDGMLIAMVSKSG
ncbi:PilZ domain-containing protein [Erythrobacter rubeus]|uniref:PilZ domain-containing protein n=1 Tax=Erythrobacter rubeus TaxID=2760803 RepID=A0ABR8KRF3_9SPHN|nr:PilZ domain-containing protein [Erythrobacter rubeus]MBD2841024.1 PilZ domain-containing protein [Erythrobacter rubeus]